MRLCAILALAVSVCVLDGSSKASILGSFLTHDGPIHHDLSFGSPFQGGGEDNIDDESRASYINADGSVDLLGAPTFSAGDVVFGMITISDIDPSGAPNSNIGQTEQLAILFSTVLGGAAGTVYAPGTIIPLIPVADAGNAYDLRNLLDATISGAASLNDDSVFVVVGNETGTDEGGTDPLNFSEATAEAEIGLFANASGWFWEMTGGLVEDHDFFDFNFVGPPGAIGLEAGGFSVQSHDLGGVAFLPVDVANAAGTAITTHDLTLDFGSVFATGDSPWTFEDEATFTINTYVPEPATIAVWSILAGIGGIVGMRRLRA